MTMFNKMGLCMFLIGLHEFSLPNDLAGVIMLTVMYAGWIMFLYEKPQKDAP